LSWRDRILHFLRVPPEPQPPPGSPPRTFRASPAYYKLLLIRWGLLQLGAIAGVVVAISIFGGFVRELPRWVYYSVAVAELFAIAALIVNAAFGWILVRYEYELRWYMVSDRAIRIREGIATVKEKTIALANIQNLSVRQGPLQRLFGIADLEVRTAGGGGSAESDAHGKSEAEPMHVAYFRGVDNAEEIRDLLMEGVRRQRDTGLGDPDEPHSSGDDLDAAVAELLSAARALRS
jgi:membrane protein YdbS with pleckstrin-like domain